MEIVNNWLGKLRKVGQKAGPYLLVAILVPGGTLLALLLFMCQRSTVNSERGAQRASAS